MLRKIDFRNQRKMVRSDPRERCHMPIQPDQPISGPHPESVQGKERKTGGKRRRGYRPAEPLVQLPQRPAPEDPFVHVAHQYRWCRICGVESFHQKTDLPRAFGPAQPEMRGDDTERQPATLQSDIERAPRLPTSDAQVDTLDSGEVTVAEQCVAVGRVAAEHGGSGQCAQTGFRGQYTERAQIAIFRFNFVKCDNLSLQFIDHLGDPLRIEATVTPDPGVNIVCCNTQETHERANPRVKGAHDMPDISGSRMPRTAFKCGPRMAGLATRRTRSYLTRV